MAAAGFLAAYSASLIAYQKIRVLSIDFPYVFYNFRCILQQILRPKFGDSNHAGLLHIRAFFLYNAIPRLSIEFFKKGEIYETKIDRNIWLMPTKYEYFELFNKKRLDGRILILYDVIEEVTPIKYKVRNTPRRNRAVRLLKHPSEVKASRINP